MVSLGTLASVVMMASHAILISLASQAGQANLVCIVCLDNPFILVLELLLDLTFWLD